MRKRHKSNEIINTSKCPNKETKTTIKKLKFNVIKVVHTTSKQVNQVIASLEYYVCRSMYVLRNTTATFIAATVQLFRNRVR